MNINTTHIPKGCLSPSIISNEVYFKYSSNLFSNASKREMKKFPYGNTSDYEILAIHFLIQKHT